MEPERTRSDQRSFAALVVAQALGSFNDNFFKGFLTYFALGLAGEGGYTEYGFAVLTSVLFIAPFVLFSAQAGWLADRFPKGRVIRSLKLVEVLLMGAAYVGLLERSFGGLLAVLSLMAVQSALFSPSKYGILPEILAPSSLARGNGVIELTNFLCIILGTGAGGWMFESSRDNLERGGTVLIAVALLGWLSSLFVARGSPAAPGSPFRRNPFAGLRDGFSLVWPDRTLRLTTLWVAYFWSLACLLQLNLLLYGNGVMLLGEKLIGFLGAAVAAGIGTGSVLAGILSRRKVELGLVPIGALGMAAFSVSLFWTWRLGTGNVALGSTVAALTLLGLAGGFFIVPLQTLLQQEAPSNRKGAVLAAANFLAFTGMLIALGVLWLLGSVFRFQPDQVFIIVGLATVAGTIYVLTLLPQQLFRLVFWIVTNTVYRVRVEGAENLPLHGPALLVANHVSFADGLLILASTHRFIRFIVYKGIAQLPPLRWLARIMRVIPIAAEDGPRAVISALKEASGALEAGELVCIFAEGQISRTGQMLPFRAGTERILRNASAPVIPVHLDQVWGSIFSFAGQKFFWKPPIRLPYPVTVSFGKPLPPTSSIEEIRQAVQELGSQAFQLRKSRQRSLPWTFLRQARGRLLRLAAVDSLGRRVTYGRLVALTVHLTRCLRPILRQSRAAGILLPPSVFGAATNLAASLLGKPAVNLNYTASKESMRSALEQTGIQGVITSKSFLEKLGLELPVPAVYLEDLAARHGRLVRLLDALAAWSLPSFLLRLWCRAPRIALDDVATIIFSSGSTGEPKGVLLSHFNILSNVQSVTQILQLGPKDRVLAVLPFFHATGYTGGLWAPLLTGMGAIYHVNPLDARTVGELARDHAATLLFATPTFLNNYTRRCDPGDFGSLSYVIAGAEKLTASVATAFRERFGVEPMEGYGCTEAAPMVSVNVPDFRGRGVFQVGGKRGTVGHPLPGVSVRIVDPDTGERLPPGKPGLLLVRGPNVMLGYLDKPELTAQVLKDGWYHTGDIAVVDEDGFIAITDRLSRFSKIAGEMVPHVKIEEALNAALELVEPAFFVTAIPDGKKGERLAVVHTADSGQLEQLFAKLPAQGLPNLWTPRADSFVHISEVPRLGTGKVDLKQLRQIAATALASWCRPPGIDGPEKCA